MSFCVPMSRVLIKPMEFQPKWRSFWPTVDFWTKSAFWTPKSTFGPKNRKIGPKGDFGPKSAPFRKSDQKVKVGLSVAQGEPGSTASGPDRIHAQPGLPELVAFSVPLHSHRYKKKAIGITKSDRYKKSRSRAQAWMP